MEDRSNIIKEAIEYRDKLEAKVKELAQSVVRLQISLDFADNTIKQKDKEITELEAENERLKNRMQTLDEEDITVEITEDEFEEYKQLKAENERLKEETIHQRKLNQELIIKYVKPYAEPTLNTELFDKNYKLSQTLQEIKKIVDECKSGINNSQCNCGAIGNLVNILNTLDIQEVE